MIDVMSQPVLAEIESSSAWAFRSLLENLDHCVYLLNKEGRYVAVNSAFTQWLGRPEREILGRTVSDLWPPPVAEKEATDHLHVLRGERLQGEEERRRGHQTLHVRILKAPVRDSKGTVQGLLGLFHEVSAERGDEASARQASKMELLGRLTSGIVHDFNNLLSVQLNNLALLQASLPLGTALEEYLHALQKAVNQGAALTDRLLRLARKDSRAFRPVDLNGICAEAVELLKHSISPRIALEVRLWPGLPPVQADPGQMMQVLMNLCFNACDAMPSGGHLLIETSLNGKFEGPSSKEESLSFSPFVFAGSPLERRGTFVCLRVSDSGEGIPPDVRSRIFEPFFTTKRSGQSTGLGLAIVAEIVQGTEGWIDCSSNVGRGTYFTIWLPTCATSPAFLPPHGAEEEGRAAALAPPSRALAQKTILLVDNEPSIVLLTQTILQRYGYRVLPAEDGRRALEIYRQKQAIIDLIILDQHMPGLSGLETLNEMLAINPHVRVLLVTGAPTPDLSWETGSVRWGFLSKPYTADQLVRAVLDVLASPLVNRES